MADAVEHYMAAERLLAAEPADEDEASDWSRIRQENLAAADVHAHLAEIGLQVELNFIRLEHHAQVEARDARWRAVFLDGS